MLVIFGSKILNKLHEKHRSEPVLLFMDEISAPDGTRKLDFSSLSSPRCDVHLILALSPVCDVGNRGRGALRPERMLHLGINEFHQKIPWLPP